MLKVLQHFLFVLSTLTLSSDDDSGLSSDLSISEEEVSSLASSYSSSESSSGPRGRRRAYRQGYYDAERQGGGYGQIPPRRRRF